MGLKQQHKGRQLFEAERENLAAFSQYSVETKEFLKRMNVMVHLFNDEGKYLKGIRANTNLKHDVTDVELLKYQSKPWEFRSDLSYIRVNKTCI
ncbi:hypothetical protein ACEQPO_24885 [Bacillus sp. SL00103]